MTSDHPPPRPQSIVTAVRLMWAGAALRAIGLLVALLSLSSIKDKVADHLRDSNTFSQDKLDTTYNAVVVSTIVFAVIAVPLWLWMSYANGAGMKWARKVAAVFGGLNVFGFVLSVAQGESTAIQLIVAAVDMLVGVAVLVLLWRPESTEYYIAKSKRP